MGVLGFEMVPKHSRSTVDGGKLVDDRKVWLGGGGGGGGDGGGGGCGSRDSIRILTLRRWVTDSEQKR